MEFAMTIPTMLPLPNLKDAPRWVVYFYGVSFALLSYGMSAMQVYFFVDWRREFGESQWFDLVFAGCFVICGILLTVLTALLHRLPK
jgi:hypothetical protein